MDKFVLAPGFRFHPTDEELVRYYLRRKVMGRPLRFEGIAVVDIYKYAPWDLPGKSSLQSKDLEWYFFCPPDRKYSNGPRTNRATEIGHWKTTGKDKSIYYNSKVVGMKKTLVFHVGRAPKGDRTDWVMHEYRLHDEELVEAGYSQDSYVLCRIFKKSGPGPKNGEQYGAPFREEDWENDEEALAGNPSSTLPDTILHSDRCDCSTVRGDAIFDLLNGDGELVQDELQNTLMMLSDVDHDVMPTAVQRKPSSCYHICSQDDVSAIFDGLEDITSSHWPVSAEMYLEDDQYLELDDLFLPLEVSSSLGPCAESRVSQCSSTMPALETVTDNSLWSP